MIGNTRLLSQGRTGQTPELVWQFLVTEYNKDEMPLVEILARDSGVDCVMFCEIHGYMGITPFTPLPDVIQLSQRMFPEFNLEYSIYDKTGKFKHPVRTCSWLWRRCTVNWDGSISPCCDIWPQSYDFGNCFEVGFRQVWNSANYQRCRQAVREYNAEADKTKRPNTPLPKELVCEACAKMGNFIESM